MNGVCLWRSCSWACIWLSLVLNFGAAGPTHRSSVSLHALSFAATRLAEGSHAARDVSRESTQLSKTLSHTSCDRRKLASRAAASAGEIVASRLGDALTPKLRFRRSRCGSDNKEMSREVKARVAFGIGKWRWRRSERVGNMDSEVSERKRKQKKVGESVKLPGKEIVSACTQRRREIVRGSEGERERVKKSS
eukprot:6206992-Pleurochrysis_carterae.AAC.1